MFSLTDLFGKVDPTKVRVTDGDIEPGDWIFNGQAMVYSPKDNGGNGSKTVIPLVNKFKVIPKNAEERGVLTQFGADMAPLAGAVAGATLFSGLVGVMGGFAAGSMLGRHVATFSCELDDGRKFNAAADFKIFKRLMDISTKEEVSAN